MDGLLDRWTDDPLIEMLLQDHHLEVILYLPNFTIFCTHTMIGKDSSVTRQDEYTCGNQ